MFDDVSQTVILFLGENGINLCADPANGGWMVRGEVVGWLTMSDGKAFLSRYKCRSASYFPLVFDLNDPSSLDLLLAECKKLGDCDAASSDVFRDILQWP